MISRGPQIVRDGLILYLDPSNKKCYPGTGSSCVDLTRSKFKYTTSNVVYGGNYFSYNGSNSYISCDSIIQLPNSTATIISWIKRSGEQALYDGIVFSRSLYVGGIFFQANNQLGYTWGNSPTMYGWQSGLVVPNLQWCMCVVCIYPLYTKLFLCESTKITSAINYISNPANTIDNLNLGRDPGSTTRYFTGDIGPSIIYNKTLSTGEIQQNFNAHRARFGI